MSRIADAMMKGEEPNLRPRPAVAVEYVDRNDPAPVEWDLEDVPRRLAPETVAAASVAPQAVAQPDTEVVELVERLFAPNTGGSGRSAVTFAPLSRWRGRHPLTLEIARTLASYEIGTVCLVDASGGAAALHEAAGADPGPGLSDALRLGQTAAGMAVPIGAQLWMVRAGNAPRDPAAAYLEHIPRAVRGLAGHFDFLIIEAPPLEQEAAIATLLALAPGTDGVVLGLDRDRTRRDRTGDVVSRLRAAGLIILGAVLVDAAAPSSATSARQRAS